MRNNIQKRNLATHDVVFDIDYGITKIKVR